MCLKKKINVARNELHFALENNYENDKVLALSRKVDEYIIKYYKACHKTKQYKKTDEHK